MIWLTLLYNWSSQPFQEQTIKPWLRAHWSVERLSALLPDVTIRYGGAVIEAREEPYRFVEFVFRKAAHLFVYAILGALAYAALPVRSGPVWKRGVIASVLVLIVSLLDEWNQTFSVMRTSTFEDVILDMTGSALGVLAAAALGRFARKLAVRDKRRLERRARDGGGITPKRR
ncbi:VanZ family protein [Paenibacillus cisolokensis]|jgi:VanZ family protein|uniref:VanZ family protein n=1 Tax=Paenibacillus cisolokensis TaxID=1658519 RepID=UPI003D26E1CE